jgi:hypothetical protein
MKAETWVNSSALLARMNFAMALAAGKMKGVQVDSEQLLPAGQPPADSGQALAMIENTLLFGDVSQQTHATVAARLEDPVVTRRKLDDSPQPPNIGVIAGLLLGSPEFQRR